jgi:hypothetical protein
MLHTCSPDKVTGPQLKVVIMDLQRSTYGVDASFLLSDSEYCRRVLSVATLTQRSSTTSPPYG